MAKENFTWLNTPAGTPKAGATTEPSITPTISGKGKGDYTSASGEKKYIHNPAPLIAAALPALIGGAASALGGAAAKKATK